MSETCNKTSPFEPCNDGYGSLYSILVDALDQAQNGKGSERHAFDGEPFESQQICILNKWCASGAIFQSCKKAIESARLPADKARHELLGAINYLAAEIIRRQNDGPGAL